MKHIRSKITIDDKEFRVKLTRCNPKFWHDKYRCNLSQFQFNRIGYNPLVIMYNGLQYGLVTLHAIEPKLYALEFARTPVYHNVADIDMTMYVDNDTGDIQTRSEIEDYYTNNPEIKTSFDDVDDLISQSYTQKEEK